MKKPSKQVIYDKTTTETQYAQLRSQLSYQRTKRPIIIFKTIYHKNTQRTETSATNADKTLNVVLQEKDLANLNSANSFELYINNKELKFDVDYPVTFETTRFYELMTEMSSTYLIKFVNDLDSDDLTLLDKQRLIAEHCRDLSYHVAKALKPTKLPGLTWKKAGKNKWQINLGFLLGTLVHMRGDLYELHIVSRDKTIHVDKTRKILSDDTSRSILVTCIDLLQRELERYLDRINVTKQAIDYVQHNEIKTARPNVIYCDLERDNELMILRHHQATMYDSVGRTENDHYQWCIRSKDLTRQELRTKLSKSRQFNMLLYGMESDRDMYGTTYGPILKPMFGVTLADIIPEDTHSDEWTVSLDNDDIYVKIKHLHGTSEYVCLELDPDVTVDDDRLEDVASILANPTGSSAAVDTVMKTFTQHLGPMYTALK